MKGLFLLSWLAACVTFALLCAIVAISSTWWARFCAGLGAVAKGVNAKLRESQEDSFIEEKPTGNALLELKLSILKRVIAVRLEQKSQRENAALVAQEIATLKEIVASKQQEGLRGLSIEELQAKIATLQAS